MNATEEKNLFKGLGNTIIKWGVGIVGSGLVVAIGLFYTIPIAVAQNTDGIKDIKTELKKITIVPILNQNKIENVEVQVMELKESQAEFQKETKESINDLRKQNLEMLELLYQIKRQNNN
jgi:hypothetical protein